MNILGVKKRQYTSLTFTTTDMNYKTYIATIKHNNQQISSNIHNITNIYILHIIRCIQERTHGRVTTLQFLQEMLLMVALFFGQSDIKLAFSLFPHWGESGTRTPPWRADLVGNTGTTQSKAGSVKTQEMFRFEVFGNVQYAMKSIKNEIILPICFSEIQPPFMFRFLLWYTKLQYRGNQMRK